MIKEQHAGAHHSHVSAKLEAIHKAHHALRASHLRAAAAAHGVTVETIEPAVQAVETAGQP